MSSRRSTDAWRGVALAAWGLLLLAGCASAPDRVEQRERPVREHIEASAEARRAFREALDLMRSGKYEGAADRLEALTERDARLAGPWINLGIAYAELDRPEDAAQALEKGLQRDPTSAAGHNQLGIVYRELGRFAEAREQYEKAIRADSGYLKAYVNLGILCDLYLQNPQCALSYFEQYQELAPAEDEKVGLWIADLRRRLD